MKKHAIIPIFIPHRGCPHTCVFCNQRAITARRPDVRPEDVQGILDTWLSTLQGRGIETIEAAFYGGSFTGLPLEEQAAFLAPAKAYKDRHLIDRIHLSTRPDYIDRPVLEQLRAYDVDIIELGVQSFDPGVLAASERGHTEEDVYRACDLIRKYGFTLGIQLMIGLPEDSREKCIASAKKTAEIGPAIARLYPTVVLKRTALADMYAAGAYHPLSDDEAAAITADMYRILTAAGVRIIRVGLKSTDLITDGGEVQGHSFHPAFRQLVEGRIAREDLEAQLMQLLEPAGGLRTGALEAYGAGVQTDGAPGAETAGTSGGTGTSCPPELRAFTFFSCPESFSNMIGNGSENKRYFAEKYPDLSIRYAVDRSLPPMHFRAEAAAPRLK